MAQERGQTAGVRPPCCGKFPELSNMYVQRAVLGSPSRFWIEIKMCLTSNGADDLSLRISWYMLAQMSLLGCGNHWVIYHVGSNWETLQRVYTSYLQSWHSALWMVPIHIRKDRNSFITRHSENPQLPLWPLAHRAPSGSPLVDAGGIQVVMILGSHP